MKVTKEKPTFSLKKGVSTKKYGYLHIIPETQEEYLTSPQ